MKALTYQGAKDVRVETVADPVFINNDDIILKVTATAIFGSDLHIYRGKIPGMKDGDTPGLDSSHWIPGRSQCTAWPDLVGGYFWGWHARAAGAHWQRQNEAGADHYPPHEAGRCGFGL